MVPTRTQRASVTELEARAERAGLWGARGWGEIGNIWIDTAHRRPGTVQIDRWSPSYLRAKVSFMYETTAELTWLQGLLDASIERSGAHLRSIVEPTRTMTAEQIVERCSDVCVLDVATTTSTGEPRLSAVDGHFLHGHWYFTTAATALKARHLRARPAASVAWTPADGLGVWAHGTAVFLGRDTAQWQRFDRHLIRAYDESPSEWGDFGDIVYLRLDPHWMVGFAMTADEQVEVDASREQRQKRLAAPTTEEL